MCGIFGYSKVTPATLAMAPYLAYAMEDRGSQSWGMAGGESIKMFKALGPISQSWHMPEWGDGPYVFHTRQASTGEVTIPNCHPFSFCALNEDPRDVHSYVVGTHNGCLSNHQALKTQYDRKDFAVDSMHIFKHIADGLPTKEINGWGALAWLFKRRLHLARFNMTDLTVVQLEDGAVVYASTTAALQRAARFANITIVGEFTIVGDHHYEVETQPIGTKDIFLDCGRMPFGGRASSIAYCGGGNTYHTESDEATDWAAAMGWEQGQYARSQRAVHNTNTTSTYYNTKDTIHELGANHRVKNLCALLHCNESVNRNKMLLCDRHFEQGLEKWRQANARKHPTHPTLLDASGETVHTTSTSASQVGVIDA